MGILDEAIREHLELKRQHGAADSELKHLEDEAFGPAGRPGDEGQVSDAVAEAPTEFMAQPGSEKGKGDDVPQPRREPSIADLQEPPPPPEAPVPPATADPAEEEHPAMEHEAITEPPPATEPETAGLSTEERHAIAEQPTEMFDVEEELAIEGGDPPRPTDEELVEEEIAEPRLAPTDPLAGLDEGGEVSVEAPGLVDDEEDEDDDFWDERRLSDELDQALVAPSEPESELDDEPGEDEEPEEEDEVEATDEPDAADEEPPPAEAEARRPDEDVLEETPDFLEETPEDDQLWFEQKPPKDFDFDD
jgi:hypothetical protein